MIKKQHIELCLLVLHFTITGLHGSADAWLPMPVVSMDDLQPMLQIMTIDSAATIAAIQPGHLDNGLVHRLEIFHPNIHKRI